MAVVGGLLSTALLTPAASADAPSSTSTNLLTGDTASLTSGTGTWAVQQGTLSVPSSSVLSVRSTAGGWVLAQSGSATASTPATAGTTYVGGMDVRASSTSRTLSPYLMFFDAQGAALAKVRGQGIASVSSSWTAANPVAAIAPPGTARVALALFVPTSATGEVHQLSHPTLIARTATRTAVVGPLYTVGRTVYDANGPLVLRGMHRNGLESTDTPTNLTPYELLQAKSWGANLLRVSLNSTYWYTDSCSSRAGYAETVDKVVNTVTQAGMVVLLDLHYNAVRACAQSKPQKMADSSALSFWSSVASRYKSNPLVAFDLYNEPHDISDAVWLRGGTVQQGLLNFQAVGMQNMYDTVRSTGAQNLIIVSGNNWANTIPSTLVTGTNIVYGVHAYTCPNAPFNGCAPNPLDPGQILNRWAARTADVPVMISEFGWPDVEDGRYVANVLSYAQAQGWGFVVFAWDGSTAGKFSTVGTMSTTLGYEPSPLGMPLLALLSQY